MHLVDILNVDLAHNFFHWHAPEFHGAKQIGSEASKMSSHQSTHLACILLVSKSDLQLVQGEPSIFWKQNPAGRAKEFAQNKNKGQRQQADQKRSGAIEEVGAEVEHARPARKRERKFACGPLQSI